MSFLTNALSEYARSTPPGLEGRGPDPAGEIHFDLDDTAIALKAIDAGLVEARATGSRAAVCVATLAPPDGSGVSATDIDAADAWLGRRLRERDRLYRVGPTFVIVASGIAHPSDAEELAARIAGLPTAPGDLLAVGLAIHPAHGDDATTLFDRARQSARRAQLERRAQELAFAGVGSQ